jgi:nucleoside-diphosphate-sugar epimerase
VTAPDTPVVVSGATGFLGGALVQRLADAGHPVRALAREPARQAHQADQAGQAARPGVTWFGCTLPDAFDPAALEGARVLVHCAYDTRFRSPRQARAVNVEGSRRLFTACREHGIARIVFVSSFSAHPAAVSVYGRSKLEVEALLDPERDLALRVGTILGEGGVFWRQAEQIASLPVVPLFYGGQQRIQTASLEDVCEALARMVTSPLTGVLRFAEPEPVALRTLYTEVAHAVGRRPRFLRLPGRLSHLGLRGAEALGFRLPLSSDNLLGLAQLRAFDVADDVAKIGVRPRPFRESLAGIRWETLTRR